MNENQGKTIKILEQELKDYKELNRTLLKKLGIIQETRKVMEQDWNPIGGYRSLSNRIADAEAKVREEAEKLNASEN